MAHVPRARGCERWMLVGYCCHLLPFYLANPEEGIFRSFVECISYHRGRFGVLGGELMSTEPPGGDLVDFVGMVDTASRLLLPRSCLSLVNFDNRYQKEVEWSHSSPVQNALEKRL